MHKNSVLTTMVAALGILIQHAQGATPNHKAEVAAIAPLTRQTEHTQALYSAHCAVCHGTSMGGSQFGPALNSREFGTKWAAKPASELLDFVSKTMPPGQAGALASNDYRDLVTFLLGSNRQSKARTSTSQAAAENARALQQAAYPENRGPIRKLQIFQDETYRQTMEERNRLLGALTPVTDEMLRSPSAKDWLSWRRTYENLSHSPLTQVNRQTVSGLTVAWAWSLPTGATEVAPLVHDGVIFVTSADQVQALDAASGALLWRYTRKLPPQYRGLVWMIHRNIAIYGDNIYVASADRHVIALAAKTGKVVWDSEIVPADLPGVLLSAGPVAVRGKVLQSTSNGTACVGGCSIVGLDASTGKELWKFDTVAHTGQPGGDTWNGASVRFGGGVWTPASYDPETNLVYYGDGGTYGITHLLVPRNGKPLGSNDALYMDSTIALDPDTGRLVWYHQHMPREIWDLDEAFERALLTLPIAGKERKLVVSTGKLGILDALDRSTGAYVFSIDFGLQNIVGTIDPTTGRRTVNPAVEPVANTPTEVCPSPEGARNWRSIAYNPNTRIMYLPMKETCMDFTWHHESDDANVGPDISWTVKPVPNSDGNYGRLVAIDLATRKTVWVRRSRAPLSSSLLATDGGIVFSGNRDRMFRAMDDRTGDTLWETRLGTCPTASPITFSVNDRQFVAVIAGTTQPLDTAGDLTPEIDDGSPATTLWVFALPDKRNR